MACEARQMRAGRGWADGADQSQLGTGARATVEQAIQHARPHRLTDACRDLRFCIHSFMVNEA